MTEMEANPSDQTMNPLAQEALRGLMRSWMDFERRLAKVPILRRLDVGTFTLDDYQRLLFNLRAQVVEGARWITRAASSTSTSRLSFDCIRPICITSIILRPMPSP